jgi:hypothetical protein
VWSVGKSAANGVAFLVSAGIVYEIVAANCSSPQTTEINASARADTLMKWVHLGQVQSAGFVGVAAWMDPERRAAILLGGAVAMIIMEGSYIHAKQAGLSSDAPGTEDYGGTQAQAPGW